MELPGIGPVIATSIIEHREANGPFNSLDELTDVARIGDVLLGNIREMITY